MPELRKPRAGGASLLLRAAALSLALLVLSGCSSTIVMGQPSEAAEPELTRYQATFLDLFDTLTTIVGYAESEEAFTETATGIQNSLREYHELYDIYDDYEGINNI